MRLLATLGSAWCLSVALVGCETAPENAPARLDDDTARTWTEGSPEAVGLLGLLNSDTVDQHFLDDIVTLDSRSADAIVHHRDGPDRLYGTRDDNPFDSIAELDGVYYVGARTIEHLLAWADRFGFVPEGDDLLGVYDGLAFTVDEAEATLDFVNAASLDLLDYDLGLDGRAASAILEAQPLTSLQQLSQVPWVGRSTLGVLRDEAIAQSCGQGSLRDLVHAIDQTEGFGATQDFEWQVALDATGWDGELLGASCHGVPAHYVPPGGVGIASPMADAEVVAKLAQLAQAAGVGAAAGLDAAECLVEGLPLLGCHLAFQIDEKSGYDQWFYVAEGDDFRLLLQWDWSE